MTSPDNRILKISETDESMSFYRQMEFYEHNGQLRKIIYDNVQFTYGLDGTIHSAVTVYNGSTRMIWMMGTHGMELTLYKSQPSFNASYYPSGVPVSSNYDNNIIQYDFFKCETQEDIDIIINEFIMESTLLLGICPVVFHLIGYRGHFRGTQGLLPNGRKF